MNYRSALVLALLLSLAVTLVSSDDWHCAALSAIPNCSFNHCSLQNPGGGESLKDWMCKQYWGPNVDQSMCIVVYENQKQCKCVCSCFLWGTGIYLPNNKTQAIETIKNGDKVLVLSQSNQKDSKERTWVSAPVHYSAGSPKPSSADKYPTIEVVQVRHQRGTLYSSHNQVFLVRDSSNKEQLLRANQLSTYFRLVDANNVQNSVAILQVTMGQQRGGLWHIATSELSQRKNLHLLNVEGIVAGDFDLQNTLQDPHLPVIGSPAYNAAYPVKPKALLKGMANQPVSDRDKAFTAHSYTAMQPGHEAAKAFLAPGSVTEATIEKYLNPIKNPPLQRNLNLFAVLWEGLNSNLDIKFQWSSRTVNVFSWREGDKTVVEVHGALTRHKLLDWQALALIISRQFEQANPISNMTYHNIDNSPFECERFADYYASWQLNAIASTGHGPTFTTLSVVTEGLKQLEAFFKSLPDQLPPDAYSDDYTSCKYAGESYACRLAAIKAGFYTDPPPQCWQDDLNNDDSDGDDSDSTAGSRSRAEL